MQKILTLGPENWLAGLVIADDYAGGGGTFISADGFDIFREPGLLQTGYLQSELATIASTPMWFRPTMENSSSEAYVYAYCLNGNLYKIDVNNATGSGIDSVVDVSAEIITSNSQGQGFAIGKAFNDATIAMVYSKNTDIRMNAVPPASGTDASIGTVTNSPYHPIHFSGVDKEFYIGDLNEVDAWDGTTYRTNVLDLDDDLTITSLSDDDKYLVIGATNNPTQVLAKSRSKVFFWNTWSPSWQREWDIPDTNLSAILKDGQKFYAFGRNGVWEFDLYTAPRFVFQKQTSTTTYDFAPKAGGVDIWKGMLTWASANETAIKAYGSPDNRLPKAFFSPFAAFTAPQALHAVREMKLYVGDNSKGYVLKTGNQTGVVATTPYIPLGNRWKIGMVKMVTSKLASGEKIAVTVKNDTGLNSIISGDHDVEGDTQGKVYDKGTATDHRAEQVQIGLTFTGAVKLKRLEIWGTPDPVKEA
jgi:hypothetical protein